MLAGLPRLPRSGCPLLVGPSRKSFLTAALGDVPPDHRVWGTAAAVTAAVLLGAHIVRVHDVAEMVARRARGGRDSRRRHGERSSVDSARAGSLPVGAAL